MAIFGFAGRDGRPQRQGQIVSDNVDFRGTEFAFAFSHIQDIRYAPVPERQVRQGNSDCPVLTHRMLHFLVGQAGNQGANSIG